MIQTIGRCEEITGQKMNWSYSEINRVGGHIWWISSILEDIFIKNEHRWEAV